MRFLIIVNQILQKVKCSLLKKIFTHNHQMHDSEPAYPIKSYLHHSFNLFLLVRCTVIKRHVKFGRNICFKRRKLND